MAAQQSPGLGALAALFIIYALVLAVVGLAFRGAERSVGVSLARARQAEAQEAEQEEEGESQERARASSSSSAPSGSAPSGSAPAPRSLLLPPLDATLAAVGESEPDIGEDVRPGWEDDVVEAMREEGFERERELVVPRSGRNHAAGEGGRSGLRAAGEGGSRGTTSLLHGLDRALDAPTARRVTPRERFEMAAKAAQAAQSARQSARVRQSAPREMRQSNAPPPPTPPPPPPRAMTPEARLMLPHSFAPPPPAPSRPPATTIYPNEDATYGAEAAGTSNTRTAPFSMSPEERILSAHIRGGGA